MITKAEKKIHCHVTAIPIRERGGRIVGAVEILRPISDPIKEGESPSQQLVEVFFGQEPLKTILERLPDMALSKAPVLILGENGTGKDLLARALHDLSSQRDGPWVRLDCGAFGERMLEVELFGCRPSPFHGIGEARSGRIQQAEGGTLFLRDVHLLPLPLQAKLLRFLQEGEIEPLGGHEPLRAEARIISSSSEDLRPLIREGRFREDLYFQLNVFQMEIPPLRSLREILPVLSDALIQRHSSTEHREVDRLSREALRLLMEYDFPGNYRELNNILRHAVILCKGETILPEHLPDGVRGSHRKVFSHPLKGENGRRMKEIEKELILAALARNNWNRKKTAEELGIDRTTLWRKMRKMGWGSKIRPT
jgi:DNA-binding NtrC family response regulator